MSSFICIVMPVTVAFSVISKNRNHRIVYHISSAFGYMALMTADSYSGILGLGTVFAVLLIWFSRSVARLKRFFLATTIMLLSGKILRLFSFLWVTNQKVSRISKSACLLKNHMGGNCIVRNNYRNFIFCRQQNSRQDFTACRSYYNRQYICCLHYCNAFCRILFQRN